jgi:DNA-directed RNA polymerase specialized sigma subunit
MNKKHLGSSFSNAVKEWEKASPKLRVLVEGKKEKAKMRIYKNPSIRRFRMAIANKTELSKLLKKLGTDETVAKKFKVTRQAIHQLRNKYGIESRWAKNPERNKKIIAMYKAGKTGTEIAGKLGLSVSQTYR